MTFDYSWLIGGPQGSGVDTAANIFSRVGTKLGYHVFGKREYHSNIKGLHSYFVVRLSDNKIRSNVNGANIMVAFDAETMIRHGLSSQGKWCQCLPNFILGCIIKHCRRIEKT